MRFRAPSSPFLRSVRPFGPALLLAALVIGTAPFMGLVRNRLFDAFGDGVVPALAGLLGLAAVTAIAAIVIRVRRDPDPRRRRRRWALLGLVTVLLVLQTFGFATSNLRVDVVEKIHIFQYGGLALLVYWGLRRQGGRSRLEYWTVPVLAGAFAGVLDETVQGFFQLRTADIRDVALNAVAAGCGLLLALALDPPDWKGGVRTAKGVRRSTRWAAALVLAAGLFYAEFHMGYEIHDPTVGTFRSWHDEEALKRAAAERTERWAEDPPTGLVAWHAEDYFLTEAAWHANHRNERYRSGDAFMALRANRILEVYYDPFLELESFRGSGRHRWSPERVAELEARLVQEGVDFPVEHYVSPVLRQRIRVRPGKGPFLVGVVLASILVWSWGRARGETLGREKAGDER